MRTALLYLILVYVHTDLETVQEVFGLDIMAAFNT